jgi:subtilisin-like proprotein convertase family protein
VGVQTQAPTSHYLGKAVNGTWKLNVSDIIARDVGSLNWAELYVLPN